MGLNIGPVTNVLSALRGAPEFGQARLRGDDARVDPPNGRERANAFAHEERPDPSQLRAGFGEGTISPLTAAFRTIDRTVKGVRESQPTIEEIRERFQSQAAERRAETFRETRGDNAANPLRAIEAGLPEPSRRVRAFAETDPVAPRETLAMNRTDEPDPATRTANAERPDRPAPAEFRAERLEAAREQDGPDRPRLDVRV